MLKKTIYFLIFSTLLVAQEKELKKGLLEQMIQPKFSINSSFIADAKVKNSKGSVDVVKKSVRLNNAIAALTYTNWSFKWHNIADLPFGNGMNAPIEQMHRFNLSTTFPYFINKEWFLLTSLSVKSTFENEMRGSYAGGAFSFASYKINTNHTIQMGAFANYHPVSSIALPVVSYSYRARQTNGLVAIVGFPRAYIGYYIVENFLLRSGAIFSQSVIKLSKHNSVVKSGYIESENYMSNFGLIYDWSKNLTIESDILYSLERNFVIYNQQGNEVNSYGVEPSFGLSFRFKYLF